jgi:hypothetical protein
MSDGERSKDPPVAAVPAKTQRRCFEVFLLQHTAGPYIWVRGLGAFEIIAQGQLLKEGTAAKNYQPQMAKHLNFLGDQSLAIRLGKRCDKSYFTGTTALTRRKIFISL